MSLSSCHLGCHLGCHFYTLYVKEKFQEDGVPTNPFPELVGPCLVDIGNLDSNDEKMAAIEKVYEEITADGGIMETIEKIKSHKWVKVVGEKG